jgi:hypothetical protein
MDDEKYYYISIILGIILAAVVVGGIIWVVNHSMNQDRVVRLQQSESCIEQGGSWIEYNGGNACTYSKGIR